MSCQRSQKRTGQSVAGIVVAALLLAASALILALSRPTPVIPRGYAEVDPNPPPPPTAPVVLFGPE